MAAEITNITDSNQPVEVWLDHILADLHAALAALERQGRDISAIKAELDAFAPVLAPFRANGVTYATLRAARKRAGSNGG